jgi:hypothetical protein
MAITPSRVFQRLTVMHDAGSIVLDLGPSGLSRIAQNGDDERVLPRRPKGLQDSAV